MAARLPLTLGLPVYNGSTFLPEAIRSILGQTFADFELVVSDNASSDATEAIVRDFAARDRRLRYHRNAENVGLTRNFNQVFSMATGKYFKWATSDDALMPDFLRRCVEVLDQDERVVLACTRARFVDATGARKEVEDPGWNLMMDAPEERLRYVIDAGHWVNSILGVIRTDALAVTGLLPDYPGGDYRLLAELSLLGKFRELPEAFYVRRLHPAASSQIAKDRRMIAEYIAGKGGPLRLPAWSRTLDNFKIVWRSNLATSRKIALSGSVLGTMKARRDRLWSEMQLAWTTRFRRGRVA